MKNKPKRHKAENTFKVSDLLITSFQNLDTFVSHIGIFFEIGRPGIQKSRAYIITVVSNGLYLKLRITVAHEIIPVA